MQQVNLYQEQFHERRLPLSAAQMTAGVLGLLLLLTALYGLEWLTLMGLEQRERELSEQTRRIESTVAALQERISSSRQTAELDAELARLEEGIDVRRRLLGVVQTRGVSEGQRFSEFVAALSRQHSQGLWLRRVDIDGGGENLLFEGSALDAELLPAFIGRLGAEQGYRGREFKTLTMTRPDEAQWRVDFLLSSRRQRDG